MTLGQRIQELRKQSGLSQEALGEALGVSRQAVSKWESDNGIPELDTLIAMSRLFGITVGQLLGVETPEEPADKDEPTTAPGFSEEQVEEILRRYIDESTRHEAPRRPSFLPWLVAICCVLAVVIVTIISMGQVHEVEKSVNNLWNNVVDIESTMNNVRNQVGGLTDELRGVLEEQSSLLSSFDYKVVSFDVEQQTVDLKLSAALKTYAVGTQMQFALKWRKTDDTTGELVCDPIDGPKFETTVTIPMNYHLEVAVLITDQDGTIHEQPTDTIYGGMHPGEFVVQFRSAGSSSQAERGFYRYELDVYSLWPELIYPTSIVTVITLDGREIYRQEEAILFNGSTYRIENEATLEDYSKKEFRAMCYVTDNYGRLVQFELPDADGAVWVDKR